MSLQFILPSFFFFIHIKSCKIRLNRIFKYLKKIFVINQVVIQIVKIHEKNNKNHKKLLLINMSNFMTLN